MEAVKFTEALLRQGRWGHAFRANRIACVKGHEGARDGKWRIDMSSVAKRSGTCGWTMLKDESGKIGLEQSMEYQICHNKA